MQTIKTAVVVVLMLVVLYGVYDVLTHQEPPTQPDVAWLEEGGLDLEIDMDDSVSLDPSDVMGDPPLDTSSSGQLGGDMPPVTSADTLGATGSVDLSTSNPAGEAPPADTTSFPPPSVESAEGDVAASATGDVDLPSATLQPPSSGSNLNEPSPSTPSNSFTPPANSGANSVYESIRNEGPSMVDTRVSEFNANASQEPPASQSLPEGFQGGSFDPVGDSGAATVQNNPHLNDASASNFGARAYDRALRTARRLQADGKHYDALNELSIFYQSPDLTPAEQAELLDLLDPLAGKVIYSRDYHFEPPYKVGRNETMMQVAEQYQVPWQLLMNINGLDNPRVLLPGTEIKVIRGPFRAEVDLSQQEMTLFLGRMYAGRFPVSVGKAMVSEGEYEVFDKQIDRAFYGSDGRMIRGGAVNNPFGRNWIDLGQDVSIHGSPNTGPSNEGCISLNPRDAQDIYGILSVGSKVKILR